MSFEFENFKLRRLIIHEIFQRDLDRKAKEPIYGNAYTSLTQDGESIFKERFVNAMGSNSHSIEMSIEKTEENSLFRTICDMMHASDNVFIKDSKHVAKRLVEAQVSRKIPGGIVVIFSGTVGRNNYNYCGIIKAEVHAGFMKVFDRDKGLAIEFISNLLLTPQQKLYKIGVFICKKNSGEEITQDDLLAFVYDHNMTAMETRQVAIYFYETFLGCNISPTDKKLTQDFYYNTKRFIDEADIDDEQKVDLHSGLYSYLKTDTGGTIKVSEFANRYFENEELRQKYQVFMRDKKMPGRAISKDLTYLKNKLKRRSMFFTSNVKISGPAERFPELVKITEQNENQTVVTITGKIKTQE